MSETTGTLALHLTKDRVKSEERFACTAQEIMSSSPKMSLGGMCRCGWPSETHLVTPEASSREVAWQPRLYKRHSQELPEGFILLCMLS